MPSGTGRYALETLENAKPEQLILSTVSPLELTLEVNPQARVDLIDVRARAAEVHGPALENYPKCLYVSAHTTAGYLPQPLATRLAAKADGIDSYIDLFRSMFPEGADYAHDKLDQREELRIGA